MRWDFEEVAFKTLLGVILVGLVGSMCAGAYTFWFWRSEINECLSKGHSKVHCDRAINGKNVKLNEGELDE